MEQIIKDLFQYNRCLLGEGYDQALDYINKTLPLDILPFESGTKVADWIVPEEWIIRDGWVKLNGVKIIDYKENPLAVTVGSLPVNKTVNLEELKKHLHISDERPGAYSYEYKFYDKDWGFSMPRNQVMKERLMKCVGGVCTPELKELDPSVGQVMIDGQEIKQEWDELLIEGDYEVFIDSEYRPGVMKVGVHTIPGKSDREILLFAHLDHPYQANDNLSGVACLMDLAAQLKDKYEHTIKLVFCPETIGSIAYASTNSILQVDFVISVDSIGNKNSLLFQKTYNENDRLNYITHLAVAGQGVDYRKGTFRLVAGADEYFFNDPQVGIPGIFLSRLPFDEYHTSDDTPDKIDYDKIIEVQKVIMKMIDFYERDFIPARHFTGPLMRSKYDVQTPDKLMNLSLDNLIYSIDGKTYLSELIMPLGMGFDYAISVMEKLQKHDAISRAHPSQKS